MKVKIAMFGREEIMQLVQLYVKDKEHIEVVPFIYENESDVIHLMDRAIMCDIYIFTESLTFLYVKEIARKKRLPIVQVPVDEYMILTSFYRLRKKHQQLLNKLSVDVPNGEVMEKVLRELGLEDSAVYTYAYGETDNIQIDDVVASHERLWNEGKIEFVLTSIKEVQNRLQEKGIPSKYMVIPLGNITEAIEQALSIVTLKSSTSALIVTGIVRIRNLEKLLEARGPAYIDDVLEYIQQTLEPFKAETDTSIFINNEKQFILFGTRGILDHITANYRDFPLLKKLDEMVPTDVTVDVGFGLGLHALEAEKHAHLALDMCKQLEGHASYIVNERQETVGPLGVKKHFNTSALYQDLIHKARLSNQLSYNFIEFITNRNNEPFSSNDVAEHYNVTKRSAERTINKLLSGKVIKHVGEERPYVKGRPRKLFQIVQ